MSNDKNRQQQLGIIMSWWQSYCCLFDISLTTTMLDWRHVVGLFITECKRSG
jgi:hypothetical protein